jgi:hypothetical protein
MLDEGFQIRRGQFSYGQGCVPGVYPPIADAPLEMVEGEAERAGYHRQGIWFGRVFDLAKTMFVVLGVVNIASSSVRPKPTPILLRDLDDMREPMRGLW